MKNIFAIASLLLLLSSAYRTEAQSIQTKTLNATGNSAVSGNIMLEWSVGEMTAIQTFISNDLMLTQGLLQPMQSLQSPLPVTWIYLKAKLQNNQAMLEWKVAQEINNHHFDIERSSDGSHFSFLKQVNSRGNSTLQQKYSAIDPSPFDGITYYRIKQVDMDGKFTYSPIATVKKGKSIEYKLYPNPANAILTIERSNAGNDDIMIDIIDLSGKTIQRNILKSGTSIINMDIKNLPNATYFIKMYDSFQVWTQSFVKQ